MRFFIFRFLVFAAVLPAVVRADAPAPGFRLKDQYGRRHELVFPAPSVSVLAFADRAGSEQLEGWLRPLYERYGDAIHIRGVARLAGVPGLLQPMLRGLFRRKVDYPVMLDWTGDVSTDYRYEAGEANVLVLSPAGRVVYRFNGRATESELRVCFARIDGLLKGAAPRPE